jgi:hypothetical protein
MGTSTFQRIPRPPVATPAGDRAVDERPSVIVRATESRPMVGAEIVSGAGHGAGKRACPGFQRVGRRPDGGRAGGRVCRRAAGGEKNVAGDGLTAWGGWRVGFDPRPIEKAIDCHDADRGQKREGENLRPGRGRVEPEPLGGNPPGRRGGAQGQEQHQQATAPEPEMKGPSSPGLTHEPPTAGYQVESADAFTDLQARGLEPGRIFHPLELVPGKRGGGVEVQMAHDQHHRHRADEEQRHDRCDGEARLHGRGRWVGSGDSWGSFPPIARGHHE